MLGRLPNQLDTLAACEVLEQLERDSTVLDDLRGSFARVGAFLRLLHAPRCIGCGAEIGTLSKWTEQLAAAAGNERASATACRVTMADIERRLRGFCSRGCETGTVRDGA